MAGGVGAPCAGVSADDEVWGEHEWEAGGGWGSEGDGGVFGGEVAWVEER